jgi:hypothetical protein
MLFGLIRGKYGDRLARIDHLIKMRMALTHFHIAPHPLKIDTSDGNSETGSGNDATDSPAVQSEWQ